ncbi:MAG: MFS transporter [Nitriliruptorales bacterium]|nr:MFS transporter [Nitriliruptorales bacterium]
MLRRRTGPPAVAEQRCVERGRAAGRFYLDSLIGSVVRPPAGRTKELHRARQRRRRVAPNRTTGRRTATRLALYVGGVVLSEVGTQGTLAAMLFHVYDLTGSTAQVGLVALAHGIAAMVVGPVGGYYADRHDRRRLLQASQTLAMVASLGLGVVTLGGDARTWHVMVAALVISLAAAFEQPTRKAIIASLVPADELVRALAVVNPLRQVGHLTGPALAGGLIVVAGPGLMYMVDAVTFGALIVILQLMTLAPTVAPTTARLWSSMREAARFIIHRPVIVQLMALDLSTTLFAAYRVVLPALAVDILQVGASGYGVLGAAPPAGALIGGVVAYRLAATRIPSGQIALIATIALGASAVVLAQARSLVVALIGAGGIGLFNAVAAVIRQAALLIESPDGLRGRVSALYGVFSKGGPAVGDAAMGCAGKCSGGRHRPDPGRPRPSGAWRGDRILVAVPSPLPGTPAHSARRPAPAKL